MINLSNPDGPFDINAGAKHKQRIAGLGDLEVTTQVNLNNLFVIWSDKEKSILHDPMTDKPVFSKNKQHLTEAAKMFKGRIVTAKEARDLLLKYQK